MVARLSGGDGLMLQDVVVLELGWRESIGWCGRMLSDLGAQVLRQADGNASPEDLTLSYLQAGKTPVTVGDALGVVDVVVTDGRDSVTAQLLESLCRCNPRLVTVSVTDYGLTGPLAATPASELTLQAEAGIVALHPTGKRPPVGMGIALAEQVSGYWAAAAAVMGLLAVEAGADGTSADVSRFESVVSVLQFPWLFPQLASQGHFPYPVPQMAVPGIEPCKDGWVCVVAVSPQQWARFKALAADPVLNDPRFDAVPERIRLVQELRPRIREFTARHTVAELVELGILHRIPIVPVTTPHTVAEFAPYAERLSVLNAVDGRYKYPRSPFRIEVGAAHLPQERPVSASATPARPLRGLRVVEIGTFQAGPLVGAHLAALGADVVRVESDNKPDAVRFTGAAPSVERFWERAAPFLGVNIGKRAISADLSEPLDRSIIERLIASSDVLVENYVPRVLDERGLDYAGVRALRDDIVMIRMPAWGSTGRWRHSPGFTYTANAASGLSWLTGYADDEPLLTGSIIDPIAGLVATTAALVAIRHRSRTGAGALIEVPLCDVALQLTARHIVAASSGAAVGRRGNDGKDAALQGIYRARDNRWVALTVATDTEWTALCELAGEPEWARDDDLAHATGRLRRHNELDAALADLCAEFNSAELVSTLRSRGIAAAPVELGTELIDHPQVNARRRVFTADHPVVGTARYLGFPVVFSHDQVPAPSGAAPLFGEHNRDVLAEVGFTSDEIERFEAAGTLACSPYNLPFDPHS
jgi:crotonobetainyl-CoA:carnitine CoA-transferase CaiB-like acyl-CoA transferase